MEKKSNNNETNKIIKKKKNIYFKVFKNDLTITNKFLNEL
jgi:hypothetical protein